MKILFLHGWTSVPGGRKPTFLKDASHAVINPALPDDDFAGAVRIAQAEIDLHHPDVVVGSSRGGAVAMNIESCETPLILLCPAWKKWGTATTVKANTTILHSRADDVVPFLDSEELVRNSSLPDSALIEVGTDHRLADPEPLARMLAACEASAREQKESLMEETPDPQMALIFLFYEGLRLKGPGSEASTLKALSMLHGLPPSPRIVDFGCGAGASSLALARATRGSITAVDIHQPFLDELNAHAVREGLADQIETVQADMGDPPFADGSFDLVWSEGAIYNIGFEDGLRRWRRLLSPGGFVAVTEATWLTDNPDQEVSEFWAAEYPAMSSIEDNVAKMRAASFDPIGHFALPTEDWQDFYGPLEERLVVFRSQHSENSEAQVLADGIQREIDIWKEFGSSYGYVFYLGRAI